MIRTIAGAALLLAGLAACDAAETENETGPATAPEAAATSAGAAESPDGSGMAQSEDALVPGTEYHATALIDCSFDGQEVADGCTAGVTRNWGEQGTNLVEVQKPDGMKRAIFYDGTTPTGADSAEADGSAGWEFTVSRDVDMVTIDFGPEHYVVPDALITGG